MSSLFQSASAVQSGILSIRQGKVSEVSIFHHVPSMRTSGTRLRRCLRNVILPDVEDEIMQPQPCLICHSSLLLLLHLSNCLDSKSEMGLIWTMN